MPNYQKAKHRKKSHSGLFKKTETIVMDSKDTEPKKTVGNSTGIRTFKVIGGNKNKNKIKKIILAAIAFVLVLTFFLMWLLLPSGFKDFFDNTTAAFSFGNSFPVDLNGNELLNIGKSGNTFFALSDSDFSSYSLSGKEIFTVQHGFSRPIMATSETRGIIADVGGSEVRVFNAKRQLYSFKTDFSVLCVDISRCGAFAVATRSDSYTSTVRVYSKNCKVIYEWFCPAETIVSVAVSSKGDKLAVAAVKAENGHYSSNLYIFNFDSADPIFSKKYDSQLIYSLESNSKKTFDVVTENSVDIISWKNYKTVTHQSDRAIAGVKNYGAKKVICASNDISSGESIFAVYNKKGNKSAEFTFPKPLTDFHLYKKHIFVLCDNVVYLLDYNGNIIKSGSCDFGSVKILPVGSGKCIVLSNVNAEKVWLTAVE